MDILAIFGIQIVVYAAFPFYLNTLRRSIKFIAFYIYLGIVLALGGFLGSVYSFPITEAITLSGGSLAYGALLMATILLVIIEKNLIVMRNVIRLVITVNIFVFLLFNSLSLALNHAAIINPFHTSFQVFQVSLKAMVVGEVLIISELLLLLVIFEWFKTRIENVFILSTLYAFFYILVLCLDGVLFPALAFGVNPELVRIIYGGLPGKFVMAAAYSLAILAFLVVFRKNLTQYVHEPLNFKELLIAPRAKLLDEIDRQRESLEMSEEKYRQLAESIKDVFFSMDSRMRCTYWNKASECMGYSSKQALGRSIYELFPQMQDTVIDKFYKDVLWTSKPGHFISEMTLCDQMRYYELFAYPLRDGLSVLARDITERQRTEKELALYREHLEEVVQQRTEALENANRELSAAKAEAEERATHDFLTGLPNRVLLLDRIAQAIALVKRTNGSVAVLSLDIDGFKNINDTYGHGDGDLLLVEFAARLKGSLREFDSVIRLGGDEFLILAPELKSRVEVESVVTRLLESVRPAVQLTNAAVCLTCSIGIALYPQNGVTPDELMANSDRALYMAKGRGKDCYAFFEPEETTALTNTPTSTGENQNAF